MTMQLANIQRPEPPRAFALEQIASAGIPCEPAGAGEYSIAGGRFTFWPATGFWRAADRARQGYGARSLIKAVAGSNSAEHTTP